MTMAPPPDEFDDIIGDLEFDPPPSIIPVSTLNEFQLSDRLNDLKEELLQRGEALHPTTQTGRDLHSERTAILVEINRRLGK